MERKLSKESEATLNYKLIQRYSFEEKNYYRRSWKLKLILSVGRNLRIHKTAFGLRVTATMVALRLQTDLWWSWLVHDDCNITVRTLTYPSHSIKYRNITLSLDNLLFQICDCCNPHCITVLNK